MVKQIYFSSVSYGSVSSMNGSKLVSEMSKDSFDFMYDGNHYLTNMHSNEEDNAQGDANIDKVEGNTRDEYLINHNDHIKNKSYSKSKINDQNQNRIRNHDE